MQPKLSLLICTLKERERQLNRLLMCLNKQITDEIEILIECDSRQITTGSKRNKLVERANGEYVAFIDDDDLVSNDYIEKVLNAAKLGKDCCSLQGEITMGIRKNGKRIEVKRIFKHSLMFKGWYESGGVYYRTPNHLNAIKKDIVKQVLYKDITTGEDQDFSNRVLPLLHTEVLIPGTIYYYLAS